MTKRKLKKQETRWPRIMLYMVIQCRIERCAGINLVSSLGILCWINSEFSSFRWREDACLLLGCDVMLSRGEASYTDSMSCFIFSLASTTGALNRTSNVSRSSSPYVQFFSLTSLGTCFPVLSNYQTSATLITIHSCSCKITRWSMALRE